MQEFFSSSWGQISIWVVGIAVVLALRQYVLKGLCFIAFKIDEVLDDYCSWHNSHYRSFSMITAFTIGSVLLSTLTNHLFARIVAYLLFAVPLIYTVWQAKLHAPLVLLAKLVSVPNCIFCLVLGSVCTLLHCQPKKKCIVYMIRDEHGEPIYFIGRDKDGNLIPVPKNVIPIIEDLTPRAKNVEVEYGEEKHPFLAINNVSSDMTG